MLQTPVHEVGKSREIPYTVHPSEDGEDSDSFVSFVSSWVGLTLQLPIATEIDFTPSIYQQATSIFSLLPYNIKTSITPRSDKMDWIEQLLDDLALMPEEQQQTPIRLQGLPIQIRLKNYELLLCRYKLADIDNESAAGEDHLCKLINARDCLVFRFFFLISVLRGHLLFQDSTYQFLRRVEQYRSRPKMSCFLWIVSVPSDSHNAPATIALSKTIYLCWGKRQKMAGQSNIRNQSLSIRYRKSMRRGWRHESTSCILAVYVIGFSVSNIMRRSSNHLWYQLC